MPIVVGAPRSGTTLLRMMLDSHSQLAIPPETYFLKWLAGLPPAERTPEAFMAIVTGAPAWQEQGLDPAELERRIAAHAPFDLAAAVRQAYGLYAEREAKSRWGDKTPVYLFEMDAIASLLPEARFVHVIRDGRDVALSQRHMWFTSSGEIGDLARDWMRWVEAGRERAARNPYLECRYERLVVAPEAELRRICDFVELEFDDAMLAYHHRAERRLGELRDRRDARGELVVERERRLHALRRVTQPPNPSRVGRWRSEMSSTELRDYEAVAGSLLAELGYSSAA